MAELLTCYSPGDKFATMDKNGTATVWIVGSTGIPYDTLHLEPREAMVKGTPKQVAKDG